MNKVFDFIKRFNYLTFSAFFFLAVIFNSYVIEFRSFLGYFIGIIVFMFMGHLVGVEFMKPKENKSRNK